MDGNLIITLLATLGGFEGVRWGISAWINRKTNARKEDAAADAAENENERKQVAWLEERIAQRDAKIDALYVELRQEQAAHLEEVHKRHEIELKLTESDMKRCEVRKCLDREPQTGY